MADSFVYFSLCLLVGCLAALGGAFVYQLYQLLRAIYEFLQGVYSVLHTVWFAVHGVLRFTLRMMQAVPIFFNSLPLWVLPSCALSLFIGIGLFLIGRK